MSKPEGPFYRCGVHRRDRMDQYQLPGQLRWIERDGEWECFGCFYENYADGTMSAQIEWDDALSLAASMVNA